jgi:DNA-binding NtrC family response regulator
MSRHAHILIVDDDTQVLGLFMRTLTREGFIVTGTTFGLDALQMALQSEPDVTILDLSMPEPDGFEILKVLHAQAPHLQVIAASGSMQGVLLNSAKLFGAAATLAKPVDPDLLLQTIREVLANKTKIAKTNTAPRGSDSGHRL